MMENTVGIYVVTRGVAVRPRPCGACVVLPLEVDGCPGIRREDDTHAYLEIGSLRPWCGTARATAQSKQCSRKQSPTVQRSETKLWSRSCTHALLCSLPSLPRPRGLRVPSVSVPVVFFRGASSVDCIFLVCPVSLQNRDSSHVLAFTLFRVCSLVIISSHILFVPCTSSHNHISA